MAKRGPRPNRGRRVREERPHRINREIRVPEVRAVGLEEYKDVIGLHEDGIYPTRRVQEWAYDLELDLVEVAPKARPPVVRIIDYSKFRYEQKKREKANKAKQHKVEMKEIRFGPNTDDHDFNFKLKHAEKFLQEGNKVRAYVQFRGRNIIYKDRGRDMLKRFTQTLGELAKVEMMPKMEGKRMVIILAPNKVPKKPNPPKQAAPPKAENPPSEAPTEGGQE